MTDFSDVTRPFTDALTNVRDELANLILLLQGEDKSFRGHKDLLTEYSMDFFGQGATAFANAVENNIARGSRFIGKMSDLVLASNNLLTLINYNNDLANGGIDRLQYSKTPFNTFDDNAPEAYGYTSLDIVTKLREAAFQFSDMNAVMDKGGSYFTNWVDGAAQGILDDMQSQHRQKLATLKDPADILQENNNIYGAQERVKFLQGGMNDNITIWFNAVGPALKDYLTNIQTAANVNAPRKVVGGNGLPQPVWSYEKHEYSSGTGWFGIPWHKDHFVTVGAVEDGGADVNQHNKGEGLNAGPFIEWSLFDIGDEWVLGDKNFGLTLGEDLKGPSVEGQAGLHEGEPGLGGGAGLGSAGANIGLNVLGGNGTLSASAGPKVDFGLNIKDGVDVKLPWVSIDLRFGAAKTAQPEGGKSE